MRKIKTRPHWERILRLIENESVPYDEMSYGISNYSNWLDRIQIGEKSELAWLEKLPKDELVDENGEFIYCDDVGNARDLSNIMYAAFVVSLWCNIENSFKWYYDLIGAGNLMQFKNKDNNFGNFQKNLEAVIGVPLNSLNYYHKVNAARILNNCFKHHDGVYIIDQKRKHEIIAQTLCLDWKIEEGRYINYSKLPHHDLVISCGCFFRDLSDKIIGLIKLKESSIS